MSTVEVDSFRPGRNFIRVGDPVRCTPVHGRAFEATVVRIRADAESGEVVEIDVVGGPKGRARAIRTVRPERIARRARGGRS